MRFEAQQSRWIWKHRAWVRLGEALTTQQVEKDLRVTPPHLGVSLALGRLITEIAPAIDHLLGRPSADAELQTPAGDEIGGAGVLRHVERVLVAHVDHRRADLDATLRSDPDQRHRIVNSVRFLRAAPMTLTYSIAAQPYLWRTPRGAGIPM